MVLGLPYRELGTVLFRCGSFTREVIILTFHTGVHRHCRRPQEVVVAIKFVTCDKDRWSLLILHDYSQLFLLLDWRLPWTTRRSCRTWSWRVFGLSEMTVSRGAKSDTILFSGHFLKIIFIPWRRKLHKHIERRLHLETPIFQYKLESPE